MKLRQFQDWLKYPGIVLYQERVPGTNRRSFLFLHLFFNHDELGLAGLVMTWKILESLFQVLSPDSETWEPVSLDLGEKQILVFKHILEILE